MKTSGPRGPSIQVNSPVNNTSAPFRTTPPDVRTGATSSSSS
jgi:hypothetical protein